MVFSFFKKDQKEVKGAGSRPSPRAPARPVRPEHKPVARPLSAPVNRSLNRPTSPELTGAGGAFAVTENALPDRELAKSLAMATAAKIDAIESEMARDFLRPRKTPSQGELAEAARDAVPVEAAPAPPEDELPVPVLPPAGKKDAPEPEEDSDDNFDLGEGLGGDIDAIEVSGASSSVIDETAILFANRQDQAAEGGLRGALVAEGLGVAAERGWLMLLELLQQRGDRAGFDQVSAQFATRFGNAAPGWINYAETPERAAAAAASGAKNGVPVVRLPENIDANIVKALEEFKTLALSHPALTLDVSAARQIDLVGAELLLRVINAFKRASHELTVRGAEQLLVALRGAVEPGRRDGSDAAWMLLLELQRMLDRQADFEETGIQYCITYEVSPPSWEPPLPNIRVSAALPAGDGPTARASDPLDWRGEILGDGDSYWSRLSTPRDSKRVVVECRQLRRVAFSAATGLLAQLMRLQTAGVAVEFRNVNCLVAALWQLLGITSLADVRVRRA